ncbi:membrane protein insertase YidC [Lacticaseibacillus thailandensis]|nr:membrane protein insertase YidC [Lacticaseibacillus thailandensis]
MNKKFKRFGMGAGLTALALVLAACSGSAQHVSKSGIVTRTPPTGFFYGSLYKYISTPISHLLDGIAHMLGTGSGYGWAILLITLVVRLVLMPFMLRQQKNMTEQQEKTRVLQPQLTLLQKAAKVSQDQTTTMQINGLMQDVYKKNGSSMLPRMGCMMMIVQLPIISGLYQAVAYSKDIANAKFLGFALGHTNLAVTIVATLFYVAQGYLMLLGSTPEQRKAMRTSMWLSPLFTFFISIVSPAGLGLYFLGTGLIMLVQQVIVTFVMLPAIRERLDKEMAETPPVQVVTPDMFNEDGSITSRAPMPSTMGAMESMGMAHPEHHDDDTTTTGPSAAELRARNAGKQHRE